MDVSRAFSRCCSRIATKQSRFIHTATKTKFASSKSFPQNHSISTLYQRSLSSAASRAQDGPSQPGVPSVSQSTKEQRSSSSAAGQRNAAINISETPSDSSRFNLPYSPGKRPTDKPSSVGNIASVASQSMKNPEPPARTTQPRPTRSIHEMLDNLMQGDTAAKTASSSSSDPLADIYNAMGPSARTRQKTLEQTILESADAAIAANSAASDVRVLRLKPTLGRTMDVSGPEDLTRAFRMLEIKCNQNKVRLDDRKQRTYVRRGQRKKDIRRQRWRSLFKEGFLAECGRIRRMRRQGW